MKTNKLLFIVLLPSLSWAVPNVSDGKLLYDESCARCHQNPYQDLGWNEMTNLIELSHMIHACDGYFQLDWNKQDFEDITEYLNSEFFKLDN